MRTGPPGVQWGLELFEETEGGLPRKFLGSGRGRVEVLGSSTLMVGAVGVTDMDGTEGVSWMEIVGIGVEETLIVGIGAGGVGLERGGGAEETFMVGRGGAEEILIVGGGGGGASETFMVGTGGLGDEFAVLNLLGLRNGETG